MRHGRGEAADGDDSDPLHGGSLRRVGAGDNDLVEPRVSRCKGQAERPSNGPSLAVQSQLADEETTRGGTRRQAADLEDRHGDGQVERGSDLLESRRRQIDRDGAAGERKPGVPERRADAFAGFADARVREPHDVETGESPRDIDLHVQNAGVDPQEGGGMNTRKHETSSARGEACGAV